jgi:hypothetical protein
MATVPTLSGHQDECHDDQRNPLLLQQRWMMRRKKSLLLPS